MLEVVTALVAEEAHSTSPHSRVASSPRDAQGTPTQSAAQDSSLQGTAAFQGTANLQGTVEAQYTADSQGIAEAQGTDAVQGAADIPQSPNDYTPTDASQTSGGDEGLLDLYALNKEVRRLKKQTISQAKQIHKLQKVRILRKEERSKGRSKGRRCLQSNWGGIKMQVICLKRIMILQQIRALETKNDEEVARNVQAEWDAEEERKRLEALKKPKTISKKLTSLVQERNQMMSFLKGQGYKNLQKLKYPQMKELYAKVQESIKDSFKDFIPMGSEKEKQMLQERDAKRLLRKRKVTVTEEQPSKKLKLRTETIDELRNYLRIVDFKKSAQDRESLEAISMITEFKVIDSPDGEYLMIYRGEYSFQSFRHSVGDTSHSG
ncbi:hypothetical protein Tco_1567204 [Tanacetum coccineum]